MELNSNDVNNTQLINKKRNTLTNFSSRIKLKDVAVREVCFVYGFGEGENEEVTSSSITTKCVTLINDKNQTYCGINETWSLRISDTKVFL